MNSYEVLTRTKEFITQGWTQNQSCKFTPEGIAEYCALGAMDNAIYEAYPRVEPNTDLAKALATLSDETFLLLDNAAVNKGYNSIVAFNDWPWRTAEEVIELIDEIISGLVEEEEVVESRELVAV